MFSIHTVQRERIVQELGLLFAEKRDVAFAYLHGSLADDGKEAGGLLFVRDMDIGIAFENCAPYESPDPRHEYLLTTSVCIDAGSIVREVTGLAVPVDARSLSGAPVVFQYEVMRGIPLAVNNPDAHADFIEWVTLRYLDMKPLLDRTMRDLLWVS